MKNSSKYKQDFINSVFAYLVNYDFLGIDLNGMFDFNNKEKQALEKIKRQYQKIKLFNDAEKEYLNESDINFITDLANILLIDIFPNMKDEILFKEIIINNSLNAYAIPVIVHEKTHALSFNHINTKNLFVSGLELLPIFIQKIAMYELEKLIDYPILVTDSIIRCNDCRSCIYYLDYARYLKINPTEQLDNYVSHYFRIKSTDYLLADIYSTILMNYYKQDRNTMIENLNKLFEDKITISEFLNKYNINLLNKDAIPLVKENLEKCKRKIIIP